MSDKLFDTEYENFLEDQIKILKETIKELEWSGLEGCCPICDCSPFNGHDIGCKVWYALNL